MIIESIAVLGILGLIFGIVIGYFSKKFEIVEDPKVDEVLKVLPGANCGACGYAGCKAYAMAIVSNRDVPINLCIPGQKGVADKVADIVGRSNSKSDPISADDIKLVVQLKCAGGNKETKEKFNYSGPRRCSSASFLQMGPKSCSYGCIGFGDCVDVCNFDALRMGDNGIPVVDKDKCTACGACIKACPKLLYKLVPKKMKVHVLCSSKDSAKIVARVCTVGCIACRLCEKACGFDAIHVNDNLAEIDYSKCTMCGKCVEACPRKIIIDERK